MSAAWKNFLSILMWSWNTLFKWCRQRFVVSRLIVLEGHKTWMSTLIREVSNNDSFIVLFFNALFLFNLKQWLSLHENNYLIGVNLAWVTGSRTSINIHSVLNVMFTYTAATCWNREFFKYFRLIELNYFSYPNH